MTDGAIDAREVQADEWRLFRELRLAALLDSPDAFGLTYEESVAASDDSWQWWISGQGSEVSVVTFVVESDGRFIGMATGAADAGDRSRAHLFGMFVAPTERNAGVGSSLASAVIKWARETGFDHIGLQVSDGNAAARHLYEQLAFRDTSQDPRPLRNGSEITTRTMRRSLR